MGPTCKQTNVFTYFCKCSWCQQDLHHRLRYDKRNMDSKNYRNQILGGRTDHILSFSPVSACSKKLPNFAVMYVDLI